MTAVVAMRVIMVVLVSPDLSMSVSDVGCGLTMSVIVVDCCQRSCSCPRKMTEMTVMYVAAVTCRPFRVTASVSDASVYVDVVFHSSVSVNDFVDCCKHSCRQMVVE